MTCSVVVEWCHQKGPSCGKLLPFPAVAHAGHCHMNGCHYILDLNTLPAPHVSLEHRGVETHTLKAKFAQWVMMNVTARLGCVPPGGFMVTKACALPQGLNYRGPQSCYLEMKKLHSFLCNKMLSQALIWCSSVENIWGHAKETFQTFSWKRASCSTSRLKRWLEVSPLKPILLWLMYLPQPRLWVVCCFQLYPVYCLAAALYHKYLNIVLFC